MSDRILVMHEGRAGRRAARRRQRAADHGLATGRTRRWRHDRGRSAGAVRRRPRRVAPERSPAGASASLGLAGRARLRRADRHLHPRLDRRDDRRRRVPDRPNIVNMLQRSVALGIVAVGQTVVILLGSLDLSVATLISARLAADRDARWTARTANVVPAIALVLGARRRRRPRQRPDHHQAARQRVHRDARHRADHQRLHREPLGRSRPARHGLVLAGPRLHALRRDPDVVLPARGRRDRGLLPAAQHALRLPHLRGRRLRGRVQALGPAHAPHDHRRARRVLADAR